MRRQSCQTRKHVLPGRLPLLPSPLRRTLRNVSASHHCKPEASPRRHPRRNSELKTGLPEVSCRSWCVFDRRRGRELMGAGQNKQREIASLSKVVNYLTCRRLAARLGVFV
jgi:D-alanyl-D-alanine carboxypeptidase